MTRVWSEGFEMQDLIEFSETGSGDTTINTSVKRSGSASMRQTGATTATKGITAISEGYLRFGFYATLARTNLIYWSSGTTNLGNLELYTDGIMYLNVGTGSGTRVASGTVRMLPNTWYLIELHIKIADNPNGVVEARIDGNPVDVTFTGDTKPGTDTPFNNILFASTATGNTSYYDDIALNNTAGGVDDSWCGEGKIIMLTPNDDVTTELTQFPALTDHHADVDEYPHDSDTTYVQGTVVDEEDLYELSASGLVAADVDTINRVWVEARTKDTVASGGEVALFIVSDATEGTGADVILQTNYNVRVSSGEFLQDPDGPAAWSVAALDALRAGVRTRA